MPVSEFNSAKRKQKRLGLTTEAFFIFARSKDLRRKFDVRRIRVRFRDTLAFFAQPVEMQGNRLVHILLDILTGAPCRNSLTFNFRESLVPSSLRSFRLPPKSQNNPHRPDRHKSQKCKHRNRKLPRIQVLRLRQVRFIDQLIHDDQERQ